MTTVIAVLVWIAVGAAVFFYAQFAGRKKDFINGPLAKSSFLISDQLEKFMESAIFRVAVTIAVAPIVWLVSFWYIFTHHAPTRKAK